MEITRIEPIVLQSKIDEISFAGGSTNITGDFRPVLVKIYTDKNIIGVGESHATGEGATSIYYGIKSLSEKLIGENPQNVNQLWNEMYTEAKRVGTYRSLSAIDEALWDIKGKSAGLPLFKLLGGETQPINAYATFPHRKPADELIEDAKWLSDAGFKLMKIAVGPNVSQAKARIKKTKENLPDNFGLAIDANTSFEFVEALEVAKTASEYEFEWFEEPIAHTDIKGQAELNRKVSVPISGYQTHTPHYPIRPHLSAEALEIYQPALDKVGGITAGNSISSLLEVYNKELIPHTFGPAINFAATLHLITAHTICDLVEFAVYTDDIDDPGEFIASPHVENQEVLSVNKEGIISPPEKPGLGVKLDNEFIDKCRINVD